MNICKRCFRPLRPTAELVDVLLFMIIDGGSDDSGDIIVRFEFVQIISLDERHKYSSFQSN